MMISFSRTNWICTSSPFGYVLPMPTSCSLQLFSMRTGIRLKLQQQFLSKWVWRSQKITQWSSISTTRY